MRSSSRYWDIAKLPEKDWENLDWSIISSKHSAATLFSWSKEKGATHKFYFPRKSHGNGAHSFSY